MKQNQLFIENLADALDEAINQLGGRKQVGAKLWPEKAPTTAGNMLGDCLNPDNRNKLSLEQIELILDMARKEGIHVIPQYIGNQYGYKIIPIEPEDEKAELQRQFISAQENMQSIINQLERFN